MKKKLYSLLFSSLIEFIKPQKAVLNSLDIGISTLLCHRDVDRFILAASSLMFFLSKPLPIHVVSDGSLTSQDYRKILAHFTVSKITTHSVAAGLRQNQSFFISYLRNTYTATNKLKFLALLTSPFTKTILLDADILFFRYPTALIKQLKNPSHQFYYLGREKKSFLEFPQLIEHELYSHRKLFRSLLSTQAIREDEILTLFFNSGIILSSIPKKDLLKFLDKVFTLFYFAHFENEYLAEEIAFSLVADHFTSQQFPATTMTVVSDWKEYKKINKEKVECIHYSADRGMKEIQIVDGIKTLLAKRLFFK